MRQLKVRQGATAGAIVSFVVAATSSAQSEAPLGTFAYITAVGLTVTVLVTIGMLAINRRSGPPRVR